jgi:hypothetical protein
MTRTNNENWSQSNSWRDKLIISSSINEFHSLLAAFKDHCRHERYKDAYPMVKDLHVLLCAIQKDAGEDFCNLNQHISTSDKLKYTSNKIPKAIIFVKTMGVQYHFLLDMSNEIIFDSLKRGLDQKINIPILKEQRWTPQIYSFISGYCYKKISNFIATNSSTDPLALKIIEQAQLFAGNRRYLSLEACYIMYVDTLSPHAKSLEAISYHKGYENKKMSIFSGILKISDKKQVDAKQIDDNLVSEHISELDEINNSEVWNHYNI